MTDATYPSDRYGWLLFGAGVIAVTALGILALRELTGVVLGILALVPIVLFVGLRNKGLIAYAIIFFALLTFDQDSGTNMREAIYYAFIAGIVAIILPYLALTGRWRLNQGLDRVYLVFFMFIMYGILLGFATGGMMKNRIDDITLIFPILIYFVLRDQIVDDKIIRNIVIILVIMMLFVAFRNIRNYQQILIEAVMSWQVQKARVAKNEVFLMLGAVGFFIMQAYQTKWIPRLFYLGLFGFLFAGLILTQSRGYWLAFLVAMIVFFIVSDPRARVRALVTSLILGVFAVTIAFTYYYSATMIVVENLAYRFSLTGGAKLDSSLLERVYETQTVWELVKANPLAGYGFGYTYQRYGLIAGYWIQTSYLHNGYLAMWFKMGFFGMLAAIGYLVMTARTGFRVFRSAESLLPRIVGLIILCQISGMMVVNITSPQFLGFDSMLLLAVMGAVAASLADRHLKEDFTQRR
jgi:O-antigen ligase